MNTKTRSQNSKFQRGTGVFKCECCGRSTRDTGAQAVGSRLCPDCWELAGIYNEYQDEGTEAVVHYATDIKRYCDNIVAKGGTLDGDATELLELAQEYL